jgi:glutamyl-tRNA synthetase
MTWLGLDWDEGPVPPGGRLREHRAAAFRLLDEGKAYRCFLSADELQRRRAEAEAAGLSFRYDRAWSAC